MSDSISRQAVIELIKNSYYNLAENMDDVWAMVEDVEQIPSADRPTGWIPVSERLPREYAQYLVCFKTGDCYVYWLEDSDWARGIAEKEDILAWMPLPEPWKDGEEE